MTYEQSITRLEEIVALLSSGTVSLEESRSLYAEGSALIAQCQKELQDAQLKFETLLPKENSNGAI